MERATDTRGPEVVPRNGNQKAKRKKYLGPESDFYDECKGKMVRIEFNSTPQRESITVRLAWVDRFTIGVLDETTGRKTLLYKSSIHSIERDGNNGRSDNSG